nr:ribonuclease H-like domain-containing protein [Tanacetum cinerariifolium]
MTGNRALLRNFIEKFLGTVRFGNNDFVVITGYEDVDIGSMAIKKVYYVERLGHNLFSVGQFCDKGLEVAFRNSTCFVRNKDGVDLLTGDHSSNSYTIALNEVASNSLTWKIHRKHHKSKTAFASNKPLYLLYMDLCGPMRIETEALKDVDWVSAMQEEIDQFARLKVWRLVPRPEEVGYSQQEGIDYDETFAPVTRIELYAYSWHMLLIRILPSFKWIIVDGVVQIVAPATAKQRLAKKNELKARGTLLMALLDKHQLKFNIYKDAKNKADLEDQSLDDLFNNLKIYEAEVNGSSPSSQNTQNIAFVSSNNTDSTNESVNVAPSISAASSKATVFTLPNVDSLSDVVIYFFFASQSNSLQLDNEDLKQINPDDLEEIDLKWQMAMLTMRAKRFLKRTKTNLGANGTYTIGFDMSKVECYNCHRRGHFAKECRSTRDNRNKDTPRKTVPVEVSTSNALVSQCSSSSLGSDNEVALYSKACSKESQVSDKTGLGFDSHVFNTQVFDCEELHSHESDNNRPKNPKNVSYKTEPKPDKIKSKREAWKSPESSPTKSMPNQNQESIKKKQDKKIKGLDLHWIEDKKMKGEDANLEALTQQAQQV